MQGVENLLRLAGLTACLLAGCGGKNISLPTPLGPVTATEPEPAPEITVQAPAAPTAEITVEMPPNPDAMRAEGAEVAVAQRIEGNSAPVIIVIGGDASDTDPNELLSTALGDTGHPPPGGEITSVSRDTDAQPGNGAVDRAASSTDSGADLFAGDAMTDEGISQAPYELGGEPHVCYGHLIENGTPMSQWEGLTSRACVDLFAEDWRQAGHDAIDFVGEPEWVLLTAARQAAIQSMALFLGARRLSGFTEFRAAVLAHDWNRARDELFNSCLRPAPNRKPGCEESTPISQARLDKIGGWLVDGE